ncbi:hypothetical protein F4680DRAFT_446226 [Xylaria scruposa]|nr:hypothetical protein F4680DRAFT_446226 [Xylaria scruposa]
MPIAPSQLDLWPGGHEGNNRHCTSLSQVSNPKFPPAYENHSQKSPTGNTPKSLHAQGESSQKSLQNSQQPQKSEEMPLKFDSTELHYGISDLPTGCKHVNMEICNRFDLDDKPKMLTWSLPSNPNLSEGAPSLTFSTSEESLEPGETDYLPGLPRNDFFWEEVNPDFDEPFALNTSLFSPYGIDQYQPNSRPSAFRPPPIARSPNSESYGEGSTGRESCRLNRDDIKPPLGGSTEGASLSNSSLGLTDESTTSSDYEDDIASDISDDILKPLVEPLLQRLLPAYSRYTLGRESGERDANESNNSGAPDSTRSPATGKQAGASYQYPRSSNPTKRKRQDLPQNSGNGEGEGEEEELPPTKRVKQLKEDALLACPFAKWKPLSYQSCYKYIMKDIRRVKQHLRRNHKRPLHCPTCWETFKVEENFYSHIEGRSCLPQPKRELEGVTSTQQEHLDRKVDRKLSRSDQWYSIFSILFPDSPRPRSAYLESDLSSELLDFQKFMATDGLEIVEQTVHEQIPASLIPQTEEIVTFSHVLFQQAIPEILKKYEATRPHNGSSDSGYESLCFSSSSHSIPDEHKVDEGTRMEPILETINPIQDPSPANHYTSCALDDLLVTDDNILNFLGANMMEELYVLDTTWSEAVEDN